MSRVRNILWKTAGRLLFKWSPHNAYMYRTGMLKLFGMKCGHRVRFRRSVSINQPWNISMGDLTMLGDYAVVDAREPICVGKRCTVSQHAMLITVVGDCTTAGTTQRKASITIEDDCWVASDTVVMPGSHIESGAVVGARSLVEGRLPKWKICIGEPAKPRSDRIMYGKA